MANSNEKNPWKNLNLKEEGKMYYYAEGDERYIVELNEAINNKFTNKKYSKKQKIAYEIHPEISPEPFWGDLENASVYILSGNPGFSGNEKKIDRKEKFKDAMMDNLKQRPSRLIWLDSKLKEDTKDEKKQYGKGKKGKASYHPGFGFWEGKTKELRNAIKKKNQLDCNIEEIPLDICVIEFFPYHSMKISGEMKQYAKKLPSCKFVDYYIEKAIKDEKWIVIARCKAEWLDRINGLKDYKNRSNNVLLTSSQQMSLTQKNLKKEVDMGADSLAGAPKWEDFVEACTCNKQ